MLLDIHGFLILLDKHEFLTLLDNHGFLTLLDNHGALILLCNHGSLILMRPLSRIKFDLNIDGGCGVECVFAFSTGLCASV